MSNLNVVALTGRLVDHMRVEISANGQAKGSFRMASDEYVGKHEGEAQYETLFINCQWKDERARSAASFLTKGKSVEVTGKLASYVLKEGPNKGLTQYYIKVREVNWGPAASGAKPGSDDSGGADKSSRTPSTAQGAVARSRSAQGAPSRSAPSSDQGQEPSGEHFSY